MSEALDNTIGVPPGVGLAATKLYARPAHTNLVARPRLVKLLDDGLSANLILVSAPAGFGKTTILAEWLGNRPHGSCWLSLDAADNDPARFWAYVILALQAIHDELAETALAQLRSPQPPPVQLILPSLLDEIDSLHDRIILVLDDYHVITSTAVTSSLVFLLGNLPSNFHLVISTRSDPPIPLARLRSRGQVVEVRSEDLRFTPEETEAFLNQTMGLALSSEQVAVLHERAEGWIAGLQMAGLSLRGQRAERVDSFIGGFAGTHHFIMDYLLEEVLAREPQEVQAFLLQTSILARLTGPLCDAVTSTSGGQEMLERLEKRNLFIVPLDDKRIWYRYHHLFADLLQAQLQRTHGREGIAALHLRASGWYEENGPTLDAIHHASLASDFERIERLIGQNYVEMMNRGEMASIRFWMGQLSQELVYQRPWLSLYEAYSRSWFGQLEEANLFLDAAEKRIHSEGATPDTQAMLGYHAYVSSRVTAMQGDTRRATELCLAAQENTPTSHLGLQLEIGVTLGYEYFLQGDFTNAIKTLHEVIRSCHAVRAVNTAVSAYCVLARLHVTQGQLHEADSVYQKAAQLIREAGGQYLGTMGLVEAGIAEVLYEWNDLEAALIRLKQGLEFLPFWGKADDLSLAYATLARIQLAQGSPTEAVGTVEKAEQLIQACAVFSEARNVIETTQVRLWLLQGDGLAADRWADTLEKRLNSHDPFRYEDELARIAQARVFIAQNKFDEAIRSLSCLEESARSGGRHGRLVEILMLRALAMQALGDAKQAEIALTEPLALAEPEHYARVFLDEGSPMKTLLSRSLAHTDASPLRHYATHLLSQFDAELHSSKVAQEKAAPTADLVEPLTPRELEVLQLIYAGDSNQAIADKLVITISAVKKHTGNILGKLGATNRAQAIVKARRLGLFPEDRSLT